MKSLFRITVFHLLFGALVFSSHAAFTSLYVFGDGVCTTTNGPGGSFYYGNRYCNGRVWVEVLAQWQGVTYESNKNWSYYGHYSSNMLQHILGVPQPSDPSNALYVVWACDADFVWNVNNYETNIVQWTNAIALTLANYSAMVTNLYYSKGARTLILPNAVDLTEVPLYNNGAPGNKRFIRQRTIDFNTRFAPLMTDTAASLPGLTICLPDTFSLLDDVVTNPTNYGLIKPTTSVNEDLPPEQWALNGPGTNYVYWDDLDPTAKFQVSLADDVQRLLSPVQIQDIIALGASNQLDLLNVPVHRDGFVEGTTNFDDWTTVQAFSSTSAVQSVVVPASDPVQQYYRLRFPFSWVWP